MAAAFFAAVSGRRGARDRSDNDSRDNLRVVGGALADRGSMMMLSESMTENAAAVREHTRALRDHREAIDRAKTAVNDGVERLVRTMFDTDHREKD